MNKKILIIIGSTILVLGLVAGALVAGRGGKMDDSGRKKIGVLVFEGALTSDITAPIEVFGYAAHDKEFPYEVVTIAVGDSKDIKTYEGLPLRAHYTVRDNPQLDVLVVPGAYNLDALYSNPRLMSYLKEQGRFFWGERDSWTVARPPPGPAGKGIYRSCIPKVWYRLIKTWWLTAG